MTEDKSKNSKISELNNFQLKKPKILIIDDSQPIREILSYLFEKNGYLTTTVGTGNEGINKINQEYFDVALIDLLLPDSDGISLLKNFKEKLPDIICIILTADTKIENAIDALKFGADGYFVKNSFMEEIIHRVDDALLKRDLRRKIEESEKHLKDILDTIPTIVYQIDEDLNIIYTNKFGFDLFGYTQNEVEKGLKISKLISLNDQERATETIKKVFKGEFIEPSDFELRRKDGSNFWGKIFGRPIYHENKIIGIRGVIFDITAQKIAEEKFKKAEEKFQQEKLEKKKMAAVARLASGVAHELNTPFANIVLTIEYLLELIDEYDVSSIKTELKELLLENKNQINYCSKIIKELFRFSKNIEINPKLFLIESILNKLKDSPEILTRIEKNNIDLNFDLQKDLKIYGDPDLLYHVFKNLIINSIDALEEINHKKRIKIISKLQEDKIYTKVIDNGKGIKDRDLLNVFEPFFSTKDIGQGNGLGLSTCKGIIEKHGGNIYIDSNWGKGTEILIILNSKPS